MISINDTNIVFSDKYTNHNDDTIKIMMIIIMIIKTRMDMEEMIMKMMKQ